ncbi:hypothetical protein COT48_06090 [Candidatus Woesearchaeota archaeon CG08_land_8_20_14_0_20_47_9]|nr:MAG: hypothetical protein AUJ69_02840 [Candidatus Woesearchaeota archaeon CG1_02_47_18]PIO03135.1 MAG: hypothetical protein COT48_06090 [Candidatus Woesearchaeota archaeon CG08_land_8_20_14_0_20_47_9]HII29558.1 hypothetical protein [Candidatus Woesearchaeota archaeon]
MVAEQETVKTEVDLLLNLVRNVKEISMSEAAKQFDIPLATVEAWATFLEEEGVLTIKYKFTTPFLVYKGEPANMQALNEIKIPVKAYDEKRVSEEEALASRNVQDSIGGLNSLLSQAYEQTDKGNLSAARETFPEAVSRLKHLREQVHSIVRVKKPGYAPELQHSFDDIEADLDAALSVAESGDFVKAKEMYFDVYQKLLDIFMKIRNVHEKTVGPSDSEAPDLAGPETETDKARSLLDRAYECLRAGKFNEAKDIYNKLKAMYQDLPHQFMERKMQLEKDMVKLNRDLSLNMDRFAMGEMEKKTREIRELISRTYREIKKNDFQLASEHYHRIRETFNSLPSGFLREKQRLEDEIIGLYKTLIARENKVYVTQMADKSKRINKLLRDMQQLMSDREIKAATDVYGEIKSIFNSPPPGFFKDKVELQNRILKVYQELEIKHRDIYYEELTRKSSEIHKLVTLMNDALRRNQLREASDLYRQIYERYNNLPPGFAENKAALQADILKSYQQLESQAEHVLTDDFNTKSGEINTILSRAFSYVKNNRAEMANGMYSQVVGIYNTLPDVFTDKKIDMRNSILDLYKEIMLQNTISLESQGKIESSSDAECRGFIKVLLRVPEHIRKASFDLVELDYRHLEQVYDSLPEGFVNRKLESSSELKSLWEELKLFHKVNALKKLADKGEFGRLSQRLNEVSDEVYETGSRSPLITYTKQLLEKCRHSLKGRSAPAEEG